MPQGGVPGTLRPLLLGSVLPHRQEQFVLLSRELSTKGCGGDSSPLRAEHATITRAPGGRLNSKLVGSKVEEGGKRRQTACEAGSCSLLGAAAEMWCGHRVEPRHSNLPW